MHVLVCDDDRATRFAVTRILTQQLGCRTSECEDGVEALQLMSRERFSFVILDIEMPLMSGVEVLELMRESPQTQTLPVVILSNVRDEHAVRHLLKLGVADYVLKPPRAEKLVAKLQRLVATLPQEVRPEQNTGVIRLSPATPAMLIDGNLDYRFFFVNQAQGYGPIQEMDSGASAVARFKASPAQIVFIGGDLGVVNASVLARKLRQLRPDGPLRIVGMLDDGAPEALKKLFDDVMPRTLLPATFREAFRPFVDIPGPLSAFSRVVPDLAAVASSAACQVFGMMFDTEVRPGAPGTGSPATACATIPIQVDERFAVTVGVYLSTETATAVAIKMFGVDEVSDEDRESVATELSNLISGRIHAGFRERGLPSVFGLPVQAPAGPVPVPSPADGVLTRFSLESAGEFSITAVVVDANATDQTKADAPAQNVTTAAETSPLTSPDTEPVAEATPSEAA